jgi:hypothetical protein
MEWLVGMVLETNAIDGLKVKSNMDSGMHGIRKD